MQGCVGGLYARGVEGRMPEKETLERAEEDAREGKSPSTQAGEFVREEMHHIREGKHGAASTKQAIAIGLSKARRAGVKLPQPKKGTASAETRSKASRDLRKGRTLQKPSRRRSRATPAALKNKGRAAASKKSPGDPGAQRRQKAWFGCSQTLRDEGRPDQGKSCSGRSQSRLNPRDLELKAPRSTTIGPPCSRSRRQSVYQKSQRQSRGRGPLDSHFSCIVRRGIEGSNLAMSAKANWPNAKLMFEAALADLDSDNVRLGGTGTVVLERARPLRAQTESVRLRRERALNEAAEALAKLWKR